MSYFNFSQGCSFIYEVDSFSGVKKIAQKVKRDISLVTDYQPDDFLRGDNCENIVIYGTIGRSTYLDDLIRNKTINVDSIKGKREVFGFWIIDNPLAGVNHAIVIAGSDKRGTIYGLFHLSETLGVSPFVNWNHVWPAKREVVLTEKNNYISKEPSVKYRGFFINDEWPAFGNWAVEHFDGINAKCYERVFELLLRLKGNYLWPAMWNSCFNLDGPGLESAMLADEYGVVMSTSHHEPCMRAGEEFTIFKGKNSIYGDAWNFRTNKEGITRFWKSGLVRNQPFENVITMGMRGERDSAILGKDAGLKANIDLLRDVLKTQNELIKETICDDLDKVPRQIVLFTEVEEFFYGNKDVKGLMGDPELEGVTLMLSDNNFGYTRTLPSEEMRDHKGGYGMYYHMDMHGGAHSYQWIGSTYLPRVWEQMTQAYEYGVKEIWVTNIGDIGTQEFGLSFFLNLAYDIEKWGGEDITVTEKYTREWVDQQFSNSFSQDDLNVIEKMMWDYTSLLAKRKHEIMNADIYNPLHFGEAQDILDLSNSLLENAEYLKARCEEKYMSGFISLLYFPVCGTANLMKMWILAGRNKLYAKQNRIEANYLVSEIDKCIDEDSRLITEYEEIDSGYYKGFGDTPHIGFTNWNDEDCKYPIRHIIYPSKEPRMLLSRICDDKYMTGQIWCDHPQVWNDCLRPDVSSIEFELSNGSDKPYFFEIITDCKWMSFSKLEGKVDIKERIILVVEKDKIVDTAADTFTVIAYVDSQKKEKIANAKVTVVAANMTYTGYKPGTFIETDGYISMKGIHYVEKKDTEQGRFQILSPYGKEGSAIKVYPPTADFLDTYDKPYVEYRFVTKEEGEYNIQFYLAPTTPVVFESKQYIGFSINCDEMICINSVENPSIPFFLSSQWETEAKDCIKLVTSKIKCLKGENILRFYGMSPGIVLEKIVIWNSKLELPESYLGPKESYRV